jgi:ATP-dependent Clp protease ATP-binding subunit ClpA
VRAALGFAVDQARRLRHDPITTGHLLLGLLDAGEGIGARILTEAGVDLQQLRSEVERALASGDPAATDA